MQQFYWCISNRRLPSTCGRPAAILCFQLVLAATIWVHVTRPVQTANANTGVGSGIWPLYGSNSGHFMVQVTHSRLRRRLNGLPCARGSLHSRFRDWHLVLLQEGVAAESQRLSMLPHGRARGWNPTAQGPQSPPARRPPAAGGSDHHHGCLRSDPDYPRNFPLMDPLTIAFAVLGMVFLSALLMWARARRQIEHSGIPDGRVVYQDTDRRRNVERPRGISKLRLDREARLFGGSCEWPDSC